MAAASNVRLKLLINTMDHKVLFAEAGKDFVDFLFYLLSLPVGAVVKLVKKNNMVGSLGELYQSIEALSETYIQPNQTKNSILNPKSPACSPSIPLLELSDNEFKPRKFYTCSNYYTASAPSFSFNNVPTGATYTRHLYVSDVPNVPCPSCKVCMNTEMSYVLPEAASKAAEVAEGGFVKGVVSYMVTDNLEVTPMSTISCITLLNKFKIKDLGSLEERIVDFAVDEGLKLLKASMECKTVLTSVFLGNMEA
ncbi:DUF674 family protein [Melia azedarach]|uniref:DUF674 family protein n=1 Tax=Melia azedarach TaxID=155640 RepID=A0ACC1Y8N2_MELAZ|nr:DUF674 family protein [Melia azedarach]